MSLVEVNGTALYYELRGSGPPLAFVSGAGGDAGGWTVVAEALADEFTVLTYDRRANSRSPRPAGWTTTSIEEQAEDAAGLLRALDLAPAVVYGSSLGAVVVIGLVLRHPQVVRGAVLHEPPLGALSPLSAAARAAIGAAIQEGVAGGGPRGGMERFLRWMNGDQRFEALPSAFRERLLGNADVFLGLELPQLRDYLPTPQQLAAVQVPCVVAAGIEDRDPQSRHGWFADVAHVLAGQLRADLVEVPGSHVPQGSHPEDLAAVVRGLARRFERQHAPG